jgi:hypothetical protein
MFILVIFCFLSFSGLSTFLGNSVSWISFSVAPISTYCCVLLYAGCYCVNTPFSKDMPVGLVTAGMALANIFMGLSLLSCVEMFMSERDCYTALQSFLLLFLQGLSLSPFTTGDFFFLMTLDLDS